MPTESTLASRLTDLETRLRALAPVAVAFSGGVDSSLLYAEARRVVGERAVAVIGVSPSLARSELEGARRQAGDLRAPLWELPVHELEREGYVANTGDRCFHCKTELYGRLLGHPELAGWTVVDGTHADDPAGDRPGMRAARELGVRSPLREAGFTKEDIRELARARGLVSWDRPARPCLASRVRVGTPVTEERLSTVEALEEVLARAGFRVYRARIARSTVTVEVGADELDRLEHPAWRREFLRVAAGRGITEVTVNPRGYGRPGVPVSLADDGWRAEPC